jgi:hypothetical protein
MIYLLVGGASQDERSAGDPHPAAAWICFCLTVGALSVTAADQKSECAHCDSGRSKQNGDGPKHGTSTFGGGLGLACRLEDPIDRLEDGLSLIDAHLGVVKGCGCSHLCSSFSEI